MTKYYIKWKLDQDKIPADPETRIKRWATLLEMFRADLDAGLLTDWGICSDWNDGYCISELDENKLMIVMMKFFPYIFFEMRPILNAQQFIEIIKYQMK